MGQHLAVYLGFITTEKSGEVNLVVKYALIEIQMQFFSR